MNDLRIFENPAFGKVRALTIDGEPWFVGRDMAAALGYCDEKSAVRDHVDSEDKRVIQKGQIASLDIPNRGLTIVNESGLYALILSSKLPKAREFKRWVTSEVLPSIRSHGAYLTPETLEAALLNPDTLIKLATELKSEWEARLALAADNAALSAQIALDAPKVRYADAVSGAAGGMLIREFCKFLKGNGKDIGEKRMFTDLRARGFLIKAKGRDYNKPTQRAMDMGLFTIRETAVEKPSGRVDTYTTPLLTGKGRQYFADLYLSPETDADAEEEG